YCDPQWVSDYTFKALFNRLKSVNGAQVVVPAHLKNRVYDRVRILDGEATWLDPWQMELPPIGELVTVMVTTSSGAQSLTGHYFPYNHLEGGVLFMLAPEVQPMSPRTFHFVAEGMSFQLSTAVGP
ncbi:MAG: hypothetical protein KC731_02170, partial [Myxococcales bacterium]|nr:hypothetical protein [Myxococcales bacterium]